MKWQKLFIQRFMDKTKKLIILFFVVFFIICIGASNGSSNISIKDTFYILLNNVFNFPIDHIDQKTISIVENIRLPRVILAFLVGGALSVSGAVVQSVLKNELVSPYTLGISAGSSFGASLVLVFGINLSFLGNFTFPIVGFLSGLFTIYIVLIFSSKVDKTFSNNTIILSGMVFSLFINGILTVLMSMFRESLETITLWQMGSFSMKGMSYVYILLPFIVVSIVGILFYVREMDILTFGEEQAKIVGVDTTKVKKRLFIFSTILAGSAVSVSGIIGFVDLISPHISRKIFGSKHILVIPVSFLIGGSLMVVADLIGRTIISPAELPVGAITAIIGAPFFAYVYFSKKKG